MSWLLKSRLFQREIIPDPRGVVGFALAFGVLVSYLGLRPNAGGFLFSENPVLEVFGHLWFILGPPLSVFLGLRNLAVHGDSVLPFLSVPLASILTVLTAIGVSLSLVL